MRGDFARGELRFGRRALRRANQIVNFANIRRELEGRRLRTASVFA
jgi:hypothetical protein